MDQTFAQELETYTTHRDELLRQSEGKFVLIKGDRMFGVFDTQGDAMREGSVRFGRGDFLVKQIVADEPAPVDWETESGKLLDDHSEAWRRLADQ
jgi:hypothetical protein